MSFMLALPKISLHGKGAIEDMVAMLVPKAPGKALIITDGQLIELGLLDGLFAALKSAALPYALFSGVTPNPTSEVVDEGFRLYQQHHCDYLIAFGGGSPIDTAKGVRILTANPGPVTAYSVCS
jgi:alcohol dehydrogenase class IV